MAKPPEICAAITVADLQAIESVGPLVGLFEARIDLMGKGWRKIASSLKKPWIACNRRVEEGGKWKGSEEKRIGELKTALELGARIIDIELSTPGAEEIVNYFRGRAEVLVSHHDLKETPPLDRLRQIIINQLAAGADICKVVTTARSFRDNLTVLQLIAAFPETKIISFAMGMEGQISRVLCPLVGGYFAYASMGQGKESAEGQITAGELREIYRIMGERK